MLKELMDSGILKNILLSGAMAAVGFVSHQMVSSAKQEQILVQHDTQIQKLYEDKATTHKDMNDLTVTVTRVEGKIDVLNQKIDDDRLATNSRRK